MILLRLSPLIPYNVLDYMSGTTSISLFNYSLALIGILPGVIVYCFLGVVSGVAVYNNTNNDVSSVFENSYSATASSSIHIISTICGVVFAAVGVAVASFYAKKELDTIIKAEQENQAGCSIDHNISLVPREI